MRDAHRSAENFGIPQLPIAVVRTQLTNQTADSIRQMVDDCLEEIVAGLTREPKAEVVESEIVTVDETWLTFEGSDQMEALDAMNARYLAYGWSDGFPLRPATAREMDRMLAGTSRAAQDVVAILEPGFGIATVEKIAANAVMAGCHPEHLPVVIAAIECLAEPKIYLRNKAMSTGPHAPLLLVNGPIRKRIGLNSGVCALGPGAPSFANTVIGRAVRLCMMNVGHTYPGISDMDTIGSPARYGMCVAENEEASPWPAYHVEQGFDAGTSTVTVQFVYGLCELHDFMNNDPAKLTEVYASAATNAAQNPTGKWLIGRRADPRYGTEEQEHAFMLICPDHAAIFRQAGWGRDDIRREMYRMARLSFRLLMLTKEPKTMAASHPELKWLWDSPETMLPVLEDPHCYDMAVVGGGGYRGTYFYGAGGPVTKAIQE